MTDPKSSLAELNQNLNILQEREAKYGGNAPLELVNQFEDHRRAITGEVIEVEWQEAFKPLLLALRDGQVVNVQAETYVAGDQIITNIYEPHPRRCPRPRPKNGTI